MLLVLGELLDQRTVDHLVADVGDQDVHDVGDLGVESVGVEDSAFVCPLGNALEVEELVVFVDEASGVEGQDHEEQCGQQDADANGKGDEVTPASLQQRHI